LRVAVNTCGECAAWEKKLERACLKVMRAERVRRDAVVSVTAVDEAGIEDMNRRYLSREGPTDVLSFPMGEEGKDCYLLGDVVICPQYVWMNSDEYDVEKGRELEFVVAHGVLHLLGYRDENEESACMMERRQREILGFAGRERR
jgi:probable rRNA maturation factor